MIFNNKVNIFMVCLVSFIAQAMQEKFDPEKKLRFFVKTSLEPVLKERSVKKLAFLCENAMAQKIRDKKNPQETLELLRNHNDYSFGSILALLSEDMNPEFEKIYEGKYMQNFCYSGKNSAWSQLHVVNYYVHTLDMLEKREYIHGEGYRFSDLKNLSVSPINNPDQKENFLFLPNMNPDRSYLHTAFHPDNTTYALGCYSGLIVVLHKINDEWVRNTLTMHGGKITALKFAPNGWLYSSSELGGTFVSVNVKNDNYIFHKLLIKKSVDAIAASSDGSLMAFREETSKKIKVIDWHALTQRTLKMRGNLVSITPSNNILMINDEALVLFDLKQNRAVYSKELPLKKVKVFRNIAAALQATSYLLMGNEQSKEQVMRHGYEGSFWDGQSRTWTEEVTTTKEEDSLYIPRTFSMEEVVKHLTKK